MYPQYNYDKLIKIFWKKKVALWGEEMGWSDRQDGKEENVLCVSRQESLDFWTM
jgi:hypothetical protein